MGGMGEGGDGGAINSSLDGSGHVRDVPVIKPDSQMTQKVPTYHHMSEEKMSSFPSKVNIYSSQQQIPSGTLAGLVALGGW